MVLMKKFLLNKNYSMRLVLARSPFFMGIRVYRMNVKKRVLSTYDYSIEKKVRVKNVN